MPVINVPESLNNMKKMKIKTEFEVSPVLQGDPNLLKIVFTNLVNNAIKYGHPDTDILLSACSIRWRIHLFHLKRRSRNFTGRYPGSFI